MADNVAIDPSTNSYAIDIATDEIASIHYPIYKQSFGIDGEVTPVSDTSPLPVALPADFVQKTKSGFGDLVTDAWGVQKVSLPWSLFHALFTFDIPVTQWLLFENEVEVQTSTDITSVNSAARLLTTVTNADVMLMGRECPRYQPNRGHLYSASIWCPNKTADGIREWGLSTPNNGVFFRLASDGLLYAIIKSAGVEYITQLVDTAAVANFDVEKGNTYDIQYQWRGVGNYKFYINNTLVHNCNLLGTLTALSMENPALPAHLRATRTTEDVELNVGCIDITSENGAVDKEVYNSMYAESVTSSTNTPVIVFKQPMTINGNINTRTITLAKVTVKCAKKAVFKVWVTRDASAITGATFKALGSGSFIETDSTDMDATAVRATSVTLASMKFITSVPVEALVRESVDNPYRGRIEFPLVRGDYLVVTCTAATGSADCVIEFGEQI